MESLSVHVYSGWSAIVYISSVVSSDVKIDFPQQIWKLVFWDTPSISVLRVRWSLLISSHNSFDNRWRWLFPDNQDNAKTIFSSEILKKWKKGGVVSGIPFHVFLEHLEVRLTDNVHLKSGSQGPILISTILCKLRAGASPSGARSESPAHCPAKGPSLDRREPTQRLRPPLLTQRQGTGAL